MYRKSVIHRFAPHLLSLLLAVTILAPLVPVPATPPVPANTGSEATSCSIDLFDSVRTQKGAHIVIDG